MKKKFFNLAASTSNNGHNPNPVFPNSYYYSPPSQQQEASATAAEEEGEGASEPTAEDHQHQLQHQANTRFSKFAPDINLETNDFRSQLKNNMKADLERRRKEDPNRGNQPAKTYLDNL